MKVKKVNAKRRELKAWLARLEAEQRHIMARIRRDRVSSRAAAFLQQIEDVDLQNVGREQQLELLQRSRSIHAFLRKHMANLQDRLSFAFARNRLLNLIPLIASEKTAFVFRRSAYWRDYLMNCLLELYYRIAKRENDVIWMDRINLFKEKWDLADKGNLGKSEIGMRALALLRKLYFYEEFCGRNRSSKCDAKLCRSAETSGYSSNKSLGNSSN